MRLQILLSFIIILFISAFTMKSFHTSSDISLGSYSLSLNVSDIQTSSEFYEKLGFSALPGMGGVEQRWMIMSNGQTRLGLFQGMFPQNTLTFNPEDARAVYAALNNQGIESIFSTGLDLDAGPCSFSILDPDGNPILIDQH